MATQFEPQSGSALKKPVYAVGVMLVMFLVFRETSCVPSDYQGKASEVKGVVHRLYDADTILVGGKRVRLVGIDAPEHKQRCKDANGKPYRCGIVATKALRRLIGWLPVTCEISGTDRHNRALGTCFDVSGTNLNGWLVSEGYAMAYRQYSLRYMVHEVQARLRKNGLWAGSFKPPWQWRRESRNDR